MWMRSSALQRAFAASLLLGMVSGCNSTVSVTQVGAPAPLDTVPPAITAWVVPATSDSLTVSGIVLQASDNVGVAGFYLSETEATPSAGANGWGVLAPTTYTFSGSGLRTLFAWAKDGAGNVSGGVSASTVITLPDTIAPAVTAFSMPATAASVTVPVNSFTANDNVAVTGYLITENTNPPSPGASAWSVSAPTSFTFSQSGTRTAYAWAKDAAGNVSSSSQATVTINSTDPTTLPLVQANNLVYTGAFRVPGTSYSYHSPYSTNASTSLAYPQGVIGFNPANNSLFIVGNAQDQAVAEISIEPFVNSTNLSSLNTATFLQSFNDVTEGYLRRVIGPDGASRWLGNDLTITGTASYVCTTPGYCGCSSTPVYGTTTCVGSTVSSASHAFGTPGNGLNLIHISGGPGFTPGYYRIAASLNGVATLVSTVGTTGSTGGAWDEEYSSSVYLGGLLVSNNFLLGSAYIYYDGNMQGTLSHFTSGLNLSNLGDFQGMYPLGNSPAVPQAGFVAGYMASVPGNWSSLLGGSVITGQTGIAITGRTSQGPAAFAFNPGDLGNSTPAPTAPLVYYTLTHSSLGTWGGTSPNPYYNGFATIGGLVFPEGTRSLLYFGRSSTNSIGDVVLLNAAGLAQYPASGFMAADTFQITNLSADFQTVTLQSTRTGEILDFPYSTVIHFCYGPGTNDMRKMGTCVDSNATYTSSGKCTGGTDPDPYCYDPANASKGNHGYPYTYQVWAYDADDLLKVKNGDINPGTGSAFQPWDLRPTVWNFDLPFSPQVSAVDLKGNTISVPGNRSILGAAYDPSSNRIYLTQQNGDGHLPIIHVFTVVPGSF